MTCLHLRVKRYKDDPELAFCWDCFCDVQIAPAPQDKPLREPVPRLPTTHSMVRTR